MPRDAGKLTEYHRRRAFDKTPEPEGGPRKTTARRSGKAAASEPAVEAAGSATGSAAGNRFAVQEHHARRLHWDLRLERDGVLVSWALPRGFPDNPRENRLAVHTEDHPLEYLTFEGDIPSGEYGAGSVTLWDEGTYEAEKFTDEKVTVRFEGRRLQGRYALFRTRDRDWLIHRMDPPAASQDPLPHDVVPMMATLSRLPPDDEAWGFEIKWDGVRALAYCEPGHLRLVGRNLRDITSQYPEIGALTRAIGARTAVLDGELIAADEQGRPSFERLQRRMHLTSPAEVRRRQRDIPVTFVIFDLLYLDGRSLLGRPYTERRDELAALKLSGPSWQTPAYQRGEGAALLAASEEQGLEGIVGKRLNSRYQPGSRSRDWLKIKNVRRQEVVIGGWVAGEGRRSGRIGALLVGYYENDGEPRLRFAGKVGTGFDDSELRMLHERLRPLRTDHSPFTGRQPQRDAVFVEPRLVCQVEFGEWTRSGTLRHPSYEGLREDKPVTEVIREEPTPPPTATEAPANDTADDPANDTADDTADDPEDDAAKGPAEEVVRVPDDELTPGRYTVEGRQLKLSNLDKVFYPDTGTTKRDVLDYYRAAAPALLPHLRGRPLTMKRYPDGVTGPHFYEKQCPSWRPDWVQTAQIWSEHNRRRIDFCVIEDLPTLLWAVNLADLEMHALLSRATDLDRPTQLVFDLDPGEGVGLVECARVGLWVRQLFDDLGLRAFVKASGSKGLHLHVPLNVPVSFDDTRQFAHAVAALIEKQHGEEVVSRMTKARRKGKVFIDWSQNSAHKTTVIPFSLRARSRPWVAVPLAWEEVEAVARRRRKSDRLLMEVGSVIDDLDHRADLIRPVLDLRQRLPRFGD